METLSSISAFFSLASAPFNEDYDRVKRETPFLFSALLVFMQKRTELFFSQSILFPPDSLKSLSIKSIFLLIGAIMYIYIFNYVLCIYIIDPL